MSSEVTSYRFCIIKWLAVLDSGRLGLVFKLHNFRVDEGFGGYTNMGSRKRDDP